MSSVDVVIGLQRGDEGKGRFVDLMAVDYQVIARGNGGANAGHTVVPEGIEPIALHQIPSGIAYPDKLNIMGNGMYIDPVKLKAELQDVRDHGLKISPKNLAISDTAHLVMPHHILRDELREAGGSAQGSTKSGIAYVASEKYEREGMRVEQLSGEREDIKARILAALVGVAGKTDPDFEKLADEWLDAAEEMKPYITDTVALIHERIAAGDKVLAEGAQAHWLDINHGMYPAVTSSSTTVAGLLDGLGISAHMIGTVSGVAKAIKSHVGGGPFVTEILDEETSTKIRGPKDKVDSEYGSTTKRPRRIGHFDLVELKNAIEINGVTELIISKMDMVNLYGETMQVATSYTVDGAKVDRAPSSALRLENAEANYQEFATWENISDLRDAKDLPDEAITFVKAVEKQLNVKVGKLGVGPEREQVVIL